MAAEHLKCDWSRLKNAESVKYTPDSDDLVKEKKKMKINKFLKKKKSKISY